MKIEIFQIRLGYKINKEFGLKNSNTTFWRKKSNQIRKIEFLDKNETFLIVCFGPHLHILTTKQTTLTSVNDTLEEQRNNRVIA